MKINEGIRDLWKSHFFETARSSKEVEDELFRKYRLTVSNMPAHLTTCTSFLRKQSKGWRQKYPNEDDMKKESMEPNFFELMKIHPEIRAASEHLYNDGHYDLAIFEAFKKIVNLVKEKAKTQEDGKSLMMKIFNEEHPVLQFNSLKTMTDKDIQEGRKFLFAGAVMALRNPRGHDDVIKKNPTTDKIIAMQNLCYASLLVDYIDESLLLQP